MKIGRSGKRRGEEEEEGEEVEEVQRGEQKEEKRVEDKVKERRVARWMEDSWKITPYKT